MTSKKVYVGLFLAVLLLVGLSALLTQKIFDLSVPNKLKPEKKDSGFIAARRDEPVSETRIELTSDPSDAKHDKKGPLPVDRMNSNRIGHDAVPPPAPTEPGIGNITSVQGSAYITSKSGKRQTLKPEIRVFLDDKIETTGNSGVQITFNDETVVSLGENSQLIIDKYVYDPESKESNVSSLRFIKGICRVFTGFITNLNPERFQVRTRMATIGIRGCDLIFESTTVRDDVYVLDLSGQKTVVVETTKNGSPMMNLLSGEPFPLDESIKETIPITEPRKSVSMTGGGSPKVRETSQQDTRQLIDRSTSLSPVKYKMSQEIGGTVFHIQPNKGQQNDGTNE